MFEAHFITATPETAAPCWHEPARDLQPQSTSQQGNTRRVQSLRHQCPLHVWAAAGKRKDNNGTAHDSWFLYIEYCTGNGTRIWQKLERTQADCNLETLFGQALWAELPRIDAARTRQWLDARDS
ncbi:hypothetical protein [Marinobacterium rhizophilum]|uniref:hypothetical protein n=1 Tax=Marinobacterium rhizophilum TaxID=420402 RepID=UPI00035C78F4|nr:hypothetical protein [Marinobacterium rhizophilum]